MIRLNDPEKPQRDRQQAQLSASQAAIAKDSITPHGATTRKRQPDRAFIRLYESAISGNPVPMLDRYNADGGCVGNLLVDGAVVFR